MHHGLNVETLQTCKIVVVVLRMRGSPGYSGFVWVTQGGPYRLCSWYYGICHSIYRSEEVGLRPPSDGHIYLSR